MRGNRARSWFRVPGLGYLRGSGYKEIVLWECRLVAVPAVWLFNYFTGKVDGFIVEMDNSASELVDYFIKNRTKQLKA